MDKPTLDATAVRNVGGGEVESKFSGGIFDGTLLDEEPREESTGAGKIHSAAVKQVDGFFRRVVLAKENGPQNEARA